MADPINRDQLWTPRVWPGAVMVEGEIDPDGFRPEGPFAEYTGYYTDELHKVISKPALEGRAIQAFQYQAGATTRRSRAGSE